MAIYPDKKNGQLTGRYQVQLQRKGDRYRQRWNTLAEAKRDEERVIRAWDSGEGLTGLPEASEGHTGAYTLEAVIPLAKDKLWRKLASETENWAKLDVMVEAMGPKTLMDSISTHTIDKLITKLSKGREDGTVNRYLSALRTFLVWSKGRGYRTAPVEDIEFSWRKESQGRIRWVTPEEEAKLQELLPPNTWKLVRAAIRTGCRRAELLSAEPDQINGNRFHIWTTKTKTPRTVPMDPQTAADLLYLSGGQMPTLHELRRHWTKARKAMGLIEDEDFVFHACRHTCATRLVDAGINVFVIKEWMGHKRIETTMRYAHVRPQNLDEALARVRLFEEQGNQNPSNSDGLQPLPTLPTGGVKCGISPQIAASANC